MRVTMARKSLLPAVIGQLRARGTISAFIAVSTDRDETKKTAR
jgi:hypothetical protein